MKEKTIKINGMLLASIREIVSKTKLFRDENDFIEQAVMRHLAKFKDV